METIKSSEDISYLFSHGKRLHTPYLTFIVLPVQQHGRKGRVAFIAGKKLGNAVWRNASKRRMREICWYLGGPWEDKDVIFLAKASILKPEYSKVLSVCQQAINRCEKW